MTKEQTVYMLAVIRGNYTFSILTERFFEELMPNNIGDDVGVMHKDPISEEELFVPVSVFKDVFHQKELWDYRKLMYSKANVRTLISTVFEIIESYCRRNGRLDEMEKQPWFWFSKIYRNMCSHNVVNEPFIWPKKLTKTGINKVSWDRYEITKDMATDKFEITGYKAMMLTGDQIEWLQGLN